MQLTHVTTACQSVWQKTFNTMTMERKKTYTAPQLTVISFNTEKGYANSLVFLTLILNNPSDTEQMQTYSVRDDWGTGDDNRFWD